MIYAVVGQVTNNSRILATKTNAKVVGLVTSNGKNLLQFIESS